MVLFFFVPCLVTITIKHNQISHGGKKTQLCHVIQHTLFMHAHGQPWAKTYEARTLGAKWYNKFWNNDDRCVSLV